MTFREHVQDHLHKSATHHAAVAELHNKISKTHETLARHHDDHAEKAESHRDLSQFHSDFSQHHSDRERHFTSLHGLMGRVADAELLPSNMDAADDLRLSAGLDGLLKVCGVLQD